MAPSSGKLKEKYRLLRARETGAVVKDPGGRLGVGLCYPADYSIGMSNLGFHQLYRLLNGYPTVLAERFFHEKSGENLISLESFAPLAGFPLICFSVSYELDFFNIPAMLSASGIPVYAAERSADDPIVIAGGASIMANPEPVAPFFDALCFGEAEAIIPEMLEALEQAISRREKLEALAEVNGISVRGVSEAYARRVYVEDLDQWPCHTFVISPESEFGHLYMVEVERGCGRHCRFCLVSRLFNPLRLRSLERLLETALEGLEYRSKIGLVGPLASIHPHIEELCRSIRKAGGQVVLSSLPVASLSTGLLSELALSGTRSVTMAPEAGSERLRKSIGKNLTDGQILEAVRKVSEAGLKGLKFYFMAGLPGEQWTDIEALKDLAIECRQAYQGALSINIAPFVPKSCTEFEHEAFMPVPELKKRLGYLKSSLSAAGIKVKTESPAWSEVQAVLSRGDERLAPVIAGSSPVSLSSWKRAIEKK